MNRFFQIVRRPQPSPARTNRNDLLFLDQLFDLAIYVCLFVAVVMGFMTGLLRSLATIFGYIAGMGVAVVAAPRVTPLLTTYLKMPTLQTWIVIVAIFVAAGAALSALLRLALNEMVGPNISVPDRVAGAALGRSALRFSRSCSSSFSIAPFRRARSPPS